MSQENVELVRRCCDALTRRDLGGYLATVSEDIVLHSQFAGVEGRTYRGHVEVPRYFQDMAEAWHRFLVEPLDPVESSEGKVACQLVTRAEAERSGVEVTKRIGAIFSVRSGKIVEIDTYPTRAEALEAAGLWA